MTVDLNKIKQRADLATQSEGWDGRFAASSDMLPDSNILGFCFGPANYPICDLKKITKGYPRIEDGSMIAVAFTREDQEFIADASPAAILEMVARIETAEGENSRLKAELAETSEALMKCAEALGNAQASAHLHLDVAVLKARVKVLTDVLKPFAKAGELFGPPVGFDQCVYAPAAGNEYNLTGDHLRAARDAIAPGKGVPHDVEAQ